MSLLKEVNLEEVIDSHTHSGGTDLYNLYKGNLPHTQSVEDLILKAQLAGVGKIVTFPFPSTGYYDTRLMIDQRRWVPSGLQEFPYQVENSALLKSCEGHEGQVLPFACIDPSTKTREQLDFLAVLSRQYKIYGLKLHSLATNSTMVELIRSGFVDFALDKNLPMVIHSDLRLKSCYPLEIVNLAARFPQLRVVVAHLSWLDQEAIGRIARADNIFTDCSPFLYICSCFQRGSHMVRQGDLFDPEQPAKSLLRCFDLLKDSLIWGTDEPWTRSIDADGTVDSDHTYQEEVEVLANLAQISPNAARAIANRNTEAFLFG